MDIKSILHPRNRNAKLYDLDALQDTYPALANYIIKNKKGESTVAFARPLAVLALNTAILKHDYGISYWRFPEENLCPPIPGRADYVHYLADLLAEDNGGVIPLGPQIRCMDIGTGASCIYPIIACVEYGWRFVATDIDARSIDAARKIVEENPVLKGNIQCRLQNNKFQFFKGVLNPKERIDLTFCNPPFYASVEQAEEASLRKQRNLNKDKEVKLERNFSGNQKELVYPGGEYGFISKMMDESYLFRKNVRWFSSLVSREDTLRKLIRKIDKSRIRSHRVIPMGTGNKKSRILVWRY